LFTLRGCNASASDGQAATQSPQPLHRSVFTTTAPFIFAILNVNLHVRTTSRIERSKIRKNLFRRSLPSLFYGQTYKNPLTESGADKELRYLCGRGLDENAVGFEKKRRGG
jgi:hypothetical protein